MNDDAKAYLSNQIIPSIKNLAREKIIAFLPESAQSNCNARMNEFNDARLGGRVLTDAEQAEIVAMRALWARARAIRDASNAHEAALMAMTTLDEVKAHDYLADWPA